MKIYGVFLLCACFLAGKFLGFLLGQLIGIGGDIGGVGFAMLLLMLGSLYLRRKNWLATETEAGIWFWSSMYIPVIVAMAATQNVKAAFGGGAVAILAGLAATILGFLLVPLITRMGRNAMDKNTPD